MKYVKYGHDNWILASIPFNIKGINLMGKVLVETIQAAYENGKIKLKEDKS